MAINNTFDAWGNLYAIIAERMNSFRRAFQNFIMQGFGMVSGGGLNLSVGNTSFDSYAYIDGYECRTSGQTTLALPDASTSHIWVKFVKTADAIGGTASIVVSLEQNTTGTAPNNSMKLGTVVTSGGSITTITELDNRMDLGGAKFSSVVDFKQSEARQFVAEKGTTFPTSPVTGQLYFRTDADKLYVRTSSTWAALH